MLSFSQTIGSLGGPGTVNFGTAGQLTLSAGSATFSGTFTGAGTLILGPGASLALGTNFNDPNLNITLAGGSLFLNGSNSTFGNLNITGNSILDFGSSSSSMLHASTVTVGAGKTLTVNDWVNTVDYFYSQNFSGSRPTFAARSRKTRFRSTDFSVSRCGAAAARWPQNSQPDPIARGSG